MLLYLQLLMATEVSDTDRQSISIKVSSGGTKGLSGNDYKRFDFVVFCMVSISSTKLIYQCNVEFIFFIGLPLGRDYQSLMSNFAMSRI